MSWDERRAAIRNVKMFANLTDAECDAMLAVTSLRTLQVGEYLFEQGKRGDTMSIVTQGALAVRLTNPSGAIHEIGTVKPGEVLGEMACIDPAPRSASAVATSPSAVFELSRGGLEALRKSAPAVSAVIVDTVIRDVTRRLREIDSRIEQQLGSRGRSAGGAAASEGQKAGGPKPLAKPIELPVPPAHDERGGFWKFLNKLKGAG